MKRIGRKVARKWIADTRRTIEEGDAISLGMGHRINQGIWIPLMLSMRAIREVHL